MDIRIADDDRILHPLRLAAGSHQAGSGKGCAMNVVSYENGDKVITDYPECSDRALAAIVQSVNDHLAGADGFLSPEDSIIALDLGHRTVGTAYHGLDDLELRRVYVRLAVRAARKVLHIANAPEADAAVAAAVAWADDPNEKNQATARAAAETAANAAWATERAAWAAAWATAETPANAAWAAAWATERAAADAARAAWAAAWATAETPAETAADAAWATERAAADAARAAGRAADVELAGELIDLFKDLTGTGNARIDPEVVTEAVIKMQTVSV